MAAQLLEFVDNRLDRRLEGEADPPSRRVHSVGGAAPAGGRGVAGRRRLVRRLNWWGLGIVVGAVAPVAFLALWRVFLRGRLGRHIRGRRRRRGGGDTG